MNRAMNVRALSSVGKRGELSKPVTIALFALGFLAVVAMIVVRIGIQRIGRGRVRTLMRVADVSVPLPVV